MKKAPEAFRTISEVAEILDTPAHVLRFWESKFYQIRPVKRAGGRRYYRPDDVALINGIKTLLQGQGMTIRGVQRVLQEQGVRHVAGLGGPLRALTSAETEEAIDTDALLPVADDGIEDAEIVETEAAEIPVEIAVDAAAEHEDIPSPATVPVEAPVAAFADQEPEPEPVDEALPDVAQPEETVVPVDAVFRSIGTTETPAEPPAGTVAFEEDESTERLDLQPDEAPDLLPDHPVEPEPAAVDEPEPAPETEPAMPVAAVPEPEPVAATAAAEASDRAILARRLRSMPRGGLGPRRDRAELLARRIDALLERMSEASGAGRW